MRQTFGMVGIAAISMGIWSVPLAAQVGDIYETFADRIVDGCIWIMDSVPSEDQLPNYQTICGCVGDSHIEYAQAQTDRDAEHVRLEWTAQFYELINHRDVAYEDIDYAIVMQCIEENSDSQG